MGEKSTYFMIRHEKSDHNRYMLFIVKIIALSLHSESKMFKIICFRNKMKSIYTFPMFLKKYIFFFSVITLCI